MQLTTPRVAQLFNEFNARSITDEWWVWGGLHKNPIFIGVIIVSLALQIMIVEVGSDFTKTSPLTINQWLVSSALGFCAVPVGILMRFIPIKEDPASFNVHID